MRYDAFISYRHGGLDGRVAEKLHKMLESYRVPEAIAKRTGKKKLARVFRDREELPTSANLSDSINEALESSEFMLLICSRRTCESLWVMREVERFGQLHGKDKIITLLIDGEPDESFPHGLREREVGGETVFVEPLAADIRAETAKGSLKLLKEEKLRLLAPILGCAFDDLRRRHRRRRLQRAAAVIAAAFAFAISFGMFSAYQLMQINRQMQLKLENQSMVLAEYSAAQLAAGDRDMAILLALAALPDDISRPQRPLVAEAEMALAEALGVYDITEGFKPHRAVTLPAPPGRVVLSPDERFAAALYPYELAIINTENGRVTAVAPTIRSALADALFLRNGLIVFTGEDEIQAYSVNGDDRPKPFASFPGRATNLAVSGDELVIAAVYKDEGRAMLFSGEAHAIGGVLGEVDFAGKSMRIPADDGFINPHDTLFALSADGAKLAVSFSDGSASVFDAATGHETVIYAPSGAVHFSGGFYGDTLLFSVVETEPYYSALVVYDAARGEEIGRYESNDLNFIPLADTYGLFASFDNHIMAVDAQTGDVLHAASSGARVAAFSFGGGGFLISERDGAYRFTAQGGVFESDYVCHFTDIGSRYALTGSRDSKTVRILKKNPAVGEAIIYYDMSYRFSEAKIGPENIVFYSHTGMRLFDFDGNLAAETLFFDPELVRNTEYDAQSGNVAVIYDSVFRLYSGTDATLLLEARGKPGVRSVIYTEFGVSVTDEDGLVTLYDLATGGAADTRQAPEGTERALILGGELVHVAGGTVFHGPYEISAGQMAFGGRMADIIGAGRIGGGYAFAVSDDESIHVLTFDGGSLKSAFFAETRGRAEAYFTGGCVFISPMHGDASAYTLDGRFIRSFAQSGYLAEVFEAGGYIAAGYVSSASERYSLLLRPDGLETVALLPGFLGMTSDGLLVLDSGARLNAVRLVTTPELVNMARYRLGGRELTAEETEAFRAG